MNIINSTDIINYKKHGFDGEKYIRLQNAFHTHSIQERANDGNTDLSTEGLFAVSSFSLFSAARLKDGLRPITREKDETAHYERYDERQRRRLM